MVNDSPIEKLLDEVRSHAPFYRTFAGREYANRFENQGHRFYFWSREDNEPPHIHVETAENAAKFWLQPIELAWAVGYTSKELRQVRELVEEHRDFFLDKWYEHLKQR